MKWRSSTTAPRGVESARPDPHDSSQTAKRDNMDWPEENDGQTPYWRMSIRRWTYSYMGRILREGSKRRTQNKKQSQRALEVLSDDEETEDSASGVNGHGGGRGKKAGGAHLTHNDIYRVPTTMEAARVHDQFVALYDEEDGHLIRTLWRLAAPTFIPAGFCQLLTVAAQVSMPLLVREFLQVLQDNPSQKVARDAAPYVTMLFASFVINAFGTSRQRHLAMKSGIVIRTGLVSVIYSAVLNLTPGGRAGLTSGEVTSLVAIDTQKLFEVTQEGHLIWSAPLSILLVGTILVLIMGPSTIVGISVFVLLLPIVRKLSRRMLSYRVERVKVTDERVEMINSMLQGIKVTKLNNYEACYEKRVGEIRQRELGYLWNELNVWAFVMSLQFISPVLATAAAFASYCLIDDSHVLTAADTFAALLLFNALRFPINYAGRLVGKASQAYESARRISAFLKRETLVPPSQTQQHEESIRAGRNECSGSSEEDVPALTVQHGSFRVGSAAISPAVCGVDDDDDLQQETGHHNQGFAVSGVNVSLNRKQVLAVVGPVGSGKSIFTNALIGETMPSSSNTVITARGKVAYAGQVPFVLNATVRDNILFGLPYDKERYEKVLDACCLRQDIEQLGSAGDLCEIGERGVTLSGGQKQRVSLARVAYSQPDIAIFDDPLSALDAGTSREVFERLFKSSNGKDHLLSSSAVVLVTHASHFLHRVDQIMILVDGAVAFLGSWSDLENFETTDLTAQSTIDSVRDSEQESHGEDGAGVMTQYKDAFTTNRYISKRNTMSFKNERLDDKKTSSDGAIMKEEEREHGLTSMKTWLTWFVYCGGMSFVGVVFFLFVGEKIVYIGTEWWLARWTQAYNAPVDVFGREFPPQSEGRSAQYEYLTVYVILLVLAFLFGLARSFWIVAGAIRCCRQLFSLMTSSILRAPMSYFDTTPLGRILNRFTYDVEILDITLTMNMGMCMVALSWFISSIAVMVAILPWMVLALVPITFVYWLLQLHYRKSGMDLQRLDAVSRSPLQAMLAEGLDGAVTIRVFGQVKQCVHRFQSATDTNTAAQLNFVSAQRWLGLRIELLGAIMVFVACLLVVTLNDVLGLDPGIAGLLIRWASSLTISISFLVDHIVEAEANITSIERIQAVLDIPHERSMETNKSMIVPDSWPQHGLLEFQNVHLRYRDGLPLALKGLSFRVEPGKRCGVVGRTGAGKSSITVGLFRIVESEVGRIIVDGVDLSKLGLSDVRGRPNGLCIIPQDPVLFAGSLRECLDPFDNSTDEAILEALSAVRVFGSKNEATILDEPVFENGANFSVGERQLLCLARAIVARPRILVMDEATASVDGETDAFIQQMLRIRFKDTTILTVAHRLNTIIDYDFILVMADGKAEEFGPPQELLKNEHGLFTEMVNSTGIKLAKDNK